MAKKLVAVTEIRHNDEVFAAGETLDASKFDKKHLEALYDAGAVRIEGAGSESDSTETETSQASTSTSTSADQSAASSSPAKSAAGTKETANAKSNAK